MLTLPQRLNIWQVPPICSCATRSTNIERADMKSRSVLMPAVPIGNQDQKTVGESEQYTVGIPWAQYLQEDLSPIDTAST